MTNDKIENMAMRQLDRARPINEFVGILVNATTLVGLAMFIYKAVWLLPFPPDDGILQLFRYAVSLAAIVFSLVAGIGLYAPLIGMMGEARTHGGLKGLGLEMAVIVGASLLNALWFIAVGFTVISLASAIFSQT